jgi:hypothetical protein
MIKHPTIEVKGMGEIEVDKLPRRVPKTVRLFGRKYPVDEEKFRLVWAINHATQDARNRIMLKRQI